ncbi:hypothetical protein [Microbulbifer sp. HZ11]|uniref:hypothetical protein n=1 Tax=Microbulbifer sp. HZ11 TaxID=1453501 RepID=UPI0012DF70E1|nr:hypothetical protein [Microbulbifer sp. HZ11]
MDILRQDLTMRRANAITIPESGGVWEAGLIAPDTPTTDSYIALVTDVPLTETALGQLLNGSSVHQHFELGPTITDDLAYVALQFLRG